MKLYGRSHPAPKLYEGDLLSGSWAVWVSRVEGVQGFLRGSWLQRSNKSKVLTSFAGSRAPEFYLRGSWLQRSNVLKLLKVSKVLGRQVSKAEEDPGSIMRFKVFRRSLKVNGFKNFLIQGLQGSKG